MEKVKNSLFWMASRLFIPLGNSSDFFVNFCYSRSGCAIFCFKLFHYIYVIWSSFFLNISSVSYQFLSFFSVFKAIFYIEIHLLSHIIFKVGSVSTKYSTESEKANSLRKQKYIKITGKCVKNSLSQIALRLFIPLINFGEVLHKFLLSNLQLCHVVF